MKRIKIIEKGREVELKTSEIKVVINFQLEVNTPNEISPASYQKT